MADTDKLSRRQRERRRHKGEILSAALELFSEKGFHEVSMQAIAAQAEFATGTLYNFFASKEALFEEMTHAFSVSSQCSNVIERNGQNKDRIRGARA